MGVLDGKKWLQNCSKSKYGMGQRDLGQVDNKKVAPMELKMVPAVTKPKIPHMVQFSAQSEKLCESFTVSVIGF